jgi:Flp pilus assembly protein TadD
MKRYEQALTDLTKAIELDPQDAWYYGYRGRTYRDIGSPDHAEVDFVRAREIDPNQDWNNPDSSLTIGEA